MRSEVLINQHSVWVALWLMTVPALAANMKTYDRVTGVCLAQGKDSLIDDMEDQDARIASREGRLGVWYAFRAGESCEQVPKTDINHRMSMRADKTSGSQYVVETRGSQCKDNTWAGGGLGIQFLAEDPGLGFETTACAQGYDASPYKGLSFMLKSEGPVRVQVCTSDVSDFNCHGYDITTKGDAWRNITIPWTQFLQEDWGPDTQAVAFNPAHLNNIQFKATTADFAVAIDNLRFLQAEVEGGSVSPIAWRAYKPDEIYRDQVRTEYENWKARYFVSCGDGSADVRKGGREGVSEGTGYGMLMAVTMDDRAVFDQLTKGFLKRKNARGMMSWQFDVCGASWGENAATDGDLDIAMALVMADRKWKTYRYLAEPLIAALKQYGTSSCDNLLVLRPGDMWGGCKDASDQRLNPSYFAPGYYRVFAQYLPNQADFWNQMAKDSYVLLRRYQTKMGGLIPDWSYVDGTLIGPYGYEACRVPWRISVDYAWHGSAEAKDILQGLHDYAESRGGPAAASDQNNSCFIGGFALTANSISLAKSKLWYRNWMTSADLNAGDHAYYQGSLRVLYLQLAGGLFLPSTDTADQPKPIDSSKPSDPTPSYSPCQSNQGRGYGSTWQSGGKTLAKDSPDFSDRSICEVVTASSGSSGIPFCIQNEGKGYGDSWLKDGFRLAKDSPDYSDRSICRVRSN